MTRAVTSRRGATVRQASVRDLRYDFKKIERALRAGEEIQITKRSKVIARLVPENQPVAMPDFEARLKAIFGDKMLEPSGAEQIAEDRDRL